MTGRLPLGVAFTAIGSWRVYFNSHSAAPRVWCVSPRDGAWELAVTSIGIDAPGETVYRSPAARAPGAPRDDSPSAWLEVDGQLTVCVTGHASIGRPDEVAPR